MSKLYPEKLIIFGNGFDLWMSLPTKYENYKNFISCKKEYQNCYNLFDFIERKLNMDNSTFDFWSNLEQGFYKFLTDNVEKTNEIINEIKNKNIDLIKACIEKNESIRKWIEQIRLEHKEKLIKMNLHKIYCVNLIYNLNQKLELLHKLMDTMRLIKI